MGFILTIMKYDYSKRGVNLPNGQKDLGEVSQVDLVGDVLNGMVVTKVDVTKNGLILAARIPELRSGELEISVEGSALHIVGRPGRRAAWANVIEVPPGYRVEDARAIYFAGNLRIVIPRE